MRRGDKAAVFQKDVASAAQGRGSAVLRAAGKARTAVSADLYLDERTWRAVAHIAKSVPSLP